MENIEFPTLEEHRAWLHKQPSAHQFDTGSLDKCVLASHIRDTNPDILLEVYYTEIKIFESEAAFEANMYESYSTPKWAEIYQVYNRRYSSFISVNECLESLEKVEDDLVYSEEFDSESL